MTRMENIQTNNPQSLAGRGFCRTFESTKIQSTMTNLQPPCEVFKPIIGFEGLYEISNLGRVRSSDRIQKKKAGSFGLLKGKILANSKDTNNYFFIRLWGPNGTKTLKIHRLIALHFIDNPEPILYTEINHKDGNPSNNSIENLEWCSRSQNQKHRYDVLGHVGALSGRYNEKFSGSKDVYQFTMEGALIRSFPSTREAARNGFSSNCVARCCRGERSHFKGYKWSYIKP